MERATTKTTNMIKRMRFMISDTLAFRDVTGTSRKMYGRKYARMNVYVQ